MEKREIKVEFKETYMPHSVTRTCVNMTEEQVIAMYDLRGDGIEWFRFIK